MLLARLQSPASGEGGRGPARGRTFLRELADFRASATPRAKEVFGAGTPAGHDELRLAVALAAWPPG
jgi:hypothetical protein